MWTCQVCSEEVEDHFDACWSCSTSRAATIPSPNSHEAEESGSAMTPTPAGMRGAKPTSRKKRSASDSVRTSNDDADTAARSMASDGNIMRPRTFGQVFATASSSLFVLFGMLMAFLASDPDHQGIKIPPGLILLLPALVAIPLGLAAAKSNQGETISKKPKDRQALLNAIELRLAERGYKLETQTSALVRYKSPAAIQFAGGSVYVILEARAVHIVGPVVALKMLREI